MAKYVLKISTFFQKNDIKKVKALQINEFKIVEV